MQKCFILFLRERVEWIKQSGCDFQHWNNKLLYSNHQPCATSLAHFCYISNWSLRCLHAPSHACIVCMQIRRLSQQQEGSDRMRAPRCFQAYFNACNYRQGREGAEESKGEEKKERKKKRAMYFWHTQRCRSVASLDWEVQGRHFLSSELEPKRLWSPVWITSAPASTAHMLPHNNTHRTS